MSWLTWTLVRRVLLVVLLVLVGYYLITFVQVWQAAESDDTRPSEAIIVLGAAQYDGAPVVGVQGPARPRLRALQGGARADDRGDRRQAAGRPVHRSPGRRELPRSTSACPTPTSCARRRAPTRGSRSRRRRRSCTTAGSAASILVSDPFHSLRIQLIAEELGFDPVTSPTRTSPISGLDEWLRYASEAVRVAFGRIFGFGSLARATTGGEPRSRTGYPGRTFGGGVIGNTTGSGPVVGGSSPPPRARRW